MELEITGVKEHKGFQLSEPKIFNTDLIVLTGKNGSGKTRFLESLQNNSSTVLFDEIPINNNEITFIQQSQLIPNLGSRYNDIEYERKITSTLEFYNKIKNDFDMPFDEQKASSHVRQHRMPEDFRDYRDYSLSYESLYKLAKKIANDLNIPPSTLSDDEIKLNFEEPNINILGFNNISDTINRYIQRKRDNQFNKWRCTSENENVKFWSDSEFVKKFGERPWIIINSIIDEIFGGKFHFDCPDETSKSYAYQAQLRQADNGLAMDVHTISSGEKTLLWLALTLFNSQYYDSELVTTPKILLLDEPDAFLHPKMVINMFQVLEAFKNNFKATIIMTTHSPTTVALAPDNSIFVVEDNTISNTSKDEGITELLDGITQISINPENRRQVFVESQYDADIYQAIYGKLAGNSRIDPKISLNFVSSGAKMPNQQLIDKAKQIFEISDEVKLNEFVEAINGIGNCVQVIGQVESLQQSDNETVRGIIDWDLKNKPSKYVSVLAQEYAYSIENITLDPISILLLLHITDPISFTISSICDSDVTWEEWLNCDVLLQLSIDKFIKKVLNQDNQKNVDLSYISGKTLLSDSNYLKMNGHLLETQVIKAYPALKAHIRSGKDGELKYSIVLKSMIHYSSGKFIPRIFEQVLSEVQK